MEVKAMKSKQCVKINRILIIMIGTFLLISILQKPASNHLVVCLTVLFICILYIQSTLKRRPAGSLVRSFSPELNLLSSSFWLQSNNQSPTLTLKAVLLIVMLLFLFFVTPYVVGKIFSSETGWTEEEQAVRRELPPKVRARWDKVFPRQSTETTVTAIRSEDKTRT
jgi:dolichol kinase